MSNTTTVNIPASTPSVASSYVTDNGTVIPAANIVNVNGTGGTTVFANPNGSNNMVIGEKWNLINPPSTVTMVSNNGYITNSSTGIITLHLPIAPKFGDEIEVVGGQGGTSGWQIDQTLVLPQQQIFFQTVNTTLGNTGKMVFSDQFDKVRLLCVQSDAALQIWMAFDVDGNPTCV
jgi:hypothetical protein